MLTIEEIKSVKRLGDVTYAALKEFVVHDAVNRAKFDAIKFIDAATGAPVLTLTHAVVESSHEWFDFYAVARDAAGEYLFGVIPRTVGSEAAVQAYVDAHADVAVTVEAVPSRLALEELARAGK